ncbi:protein sidekick-1-like [Saccoglossus kowalevskii]
MTTYVETVAYDNGMADYWLFTNSTSLDGCLVTNLKALTGYKFRVSCLNEVGSSPWTPLIDGETMMGVPSASPEPIIVYLIDNTTIGIEWTPIDSSDVNGILSGYRIQYINMDTNAETTLRCDPDITHATIISVDPNVNYSVSMWGYTAGGDGVKSDTIVVSYQMLLERTSTSPPSISGMTTGTF